MRPFYLDELPAVDFQYVDFEININKGRQSKYADYYEHVKYLEGDFHYIIKVPSHVLKYEKMEAVLKIYYRGKLIVERKQKLEVI